MTTQQSEASGSHAAEMAGHSELFPSQAEEGFLFDETDIEVIHIPGETHIAGANVRYTLHLPRDPDLVTDDATTVVGHGYFGIHKAYYELADSLAAHGIPTATIDPVRSMGLIGDLNPANYKKPITLNSKAIWAVMKDISRQQGTEIFDILGHSLGGRSGTEAARAHPEYVRHLSLYGSVGISGHKLPEMVASLAKVGVDEFPHAAKHLVQVHGHSVGIDILRYALRNPVRTVAEGLAAGSSEIKQDIQLLRAEGVKTSKVYFPLDGFFHPTKVVKNAEGLFDMLHLYDDPESNHVALQTDPRGVAIAHMAISKELTGRRPDLTIVA